MLQGWRLDTPLLKGQYTEKLYGTKITVYMRTCGKLWTQRYKDKETQLHYARGNGAHKGTAWPQCSSLNLQFPFFPAFCFANAQVSFSNTG